MQEVMVNRMYRPVVSGKASETHASPEVTVQLLATVLQSLASSETRTFMV